MRVAQPVPTASAVRDIRHVTDAARPAATPSSGHASAGKIYVVAVEHLPDLVRHSDAWKALAEVATDANVFLEPWQMLPAVEAFGDGKSSLFLFVYRSAEKTGQGPDLIGFFPFERKSRYRGLPVRLLTTWNHPHRFLGTPLLDRKWPREAWGALFDWLTAHPSEATLVELPLLACDGAGYHAFVDSTRQRAMLTFDEDRFTRATLLKQPTAETANGSSQPALGGAASGGMRKEWRRQRRRLGERGRLELRQLASGDEAAGWIDNFLALEKSGWKGRDGTALGAHVNEAAYFKAIASNASRLGRLQMLGLFLDDKPIAMKCNFLSQDTAFTFKIAFDEAWKAYSPGVLLELDFIEAFESDASLRLADSCAIPDHEMIGRLWRSRRGLANVLVSPCSRRGNLTLGLLSMLRAIARSFSKRPTTEGSTAP